jgi:hypothetical protein
MESITAIVHNGRIELAQPVEWPDGTRVEVRPINNPLVRTDWLSLPPIGVGELSKPVSDELQARQVTFEEFEAGLDELASASDTIPVLPAEAYTRESIYGDD